MISVTKAVEKIHAVKAALTDKLRGSAGSDADIVDGYMLTDIACSLAPLLGRRVDSETVKDSITDLIGLSLTEGLVDELSFRLGGNFDSLSKGKVVLPCLNTYSGKEAFFKVDYVSSSKAERHRMNMIVITGDMAGRKALYEFTKWRFLSKQFGFPMGIRFKCIPADFTSLLGLGSFLPREGNPGIRLEEVRATGLCAKHNKYILSLRYVDCPKGHNYHCSSCLTGRDKCQAALRKTTKIPESANGPVF